MNNGSRLMSSNRGERLGKGLHRASWGTAQRVPTHNSQRGSEPDSFMQIIGSPVSELCTRNLEQPYSKPFPVGRDEREHL
jgi:hypothetical protein